jgi:type IV pilus assembly protein PilE
MMQINRGFSLIEIMIVLVIMTILSAIAIPTYSSHMTRANRMAAEVSLSKLATLLEQYSIKNNTYEHATLENLNITSPKNYQLEIVQATASDFVIAAHPIDIQAKNDTECATLSLNSQNVKSISGIGTVEECW